MDLTWDELKKEVTLAVENEVSCFLHDVLFLTSTLCSVLMVR